MHAPLRPKLYESPVLVWTVGKVASSSIHATLLAEGFDALHIHYLSDWHLTHQINGMYARKRLPLHAVTSLRFRHGLDRNLYQTPIRIVTLVRDPLARNVSAYFENLQHFSRQIGRTADAETHVENFLDRYPHEIVLDWFDDEIKDVTGIDYRTIGFDPQRGWLIHRTGKFELLVLRAESSDAAKLEALSAFFGRKIAKLVRQNEASSKDYKDLYRAFRDQLRLPRSHIDFMYDNEFCATFWTSAETEAMRRAWSVSEKPAPPIVRGAHGAAAEYGGAIAAYASNDIVADVSSTCVFTREGFGGHVRLHVGFELKRALAEPDIALCLHSSDGALLCVLRPNRQDARKPLAAGPHEINVDIADAPLAAGICQVLLHVGNAEEGTLYEAIVGDLYVALPERTQAGLLSLSYRWRQNSAADTKKR